MNLAPRYWLSAIMLAVLAFLSSSAYAGMTPVEVKVFEGAKAKAEKGDADAQFMLGYCYYLGRGVAKDQFEAAKWYRKAADQGNASAQHLVGSFYASGMGVAKDEVEAVKWYRKAAEQGDSSHQLILAFCYDDGKGVAKDFVEAVKWYRKAADQGNASAQYYLGRRYELGEGVAKDEVEAYAYFNLAGITFEMARVHLANFESKLSRDEVAAGQKRTKELQKDIEAKIAAKQAGK